MDSYEVTATIKRSGEPSTTLEFVVEATHQNDAMIIGASKLYAMFAGTDTGIITITVSVIVPTS